MVSVLCYHMTCSIGILVVRAGTDLFHLGG